MGQTDRHRPLSHHKVPLIPAQNSAEDMSRAVGQTEQGASKLGTGGLGHSISLFYGRTRNEGGISSASQRKRAKPDFFQRASPGSVLDTRTSTDQARVRVRMRVCMSMRVRGVRSSPWTPPPTRGQQGRGCAGRGFSAAPPAFQPSRDSSQHRMEQILQPRTIGGSFFFKGGGEGVRL